MKKDHSNRRKNQGVVNYTEPGSGYQLPVNRYTRTIAALEERLHLKDGVLDFWSNGKYINPKIHPSNSPLSTTIRRLPSLIA
ncbi:MAG: hypothetical protein HUU32_21280 [Calditrichaceae bacterium]|nr:hypothetical protein [Calditrichia bacterium]NUQ43929.1 hypothetical protein [Calditrichaceae bacterium]